MKALRLILGDQLSMQISSLQDIDPENDVILMAEVNTETGYVPHHKKKLVFVLSAMRHFAKKLQENGYQVVYRQLLDKHNQGSLSKEAISYAQQHNISKIIVTHPGEYRVLESLKNDIEVEGLALTVLPDQRFICSPEEFQKWADNRKELTMEYFYREMRKRTGLLMENGKPIGGKWNFDKQNRKAIKNIEKFRKPKAFEPDSITQDVIELVEQQFPDNMGTADDFCFAVTHEQAQKALAHFINYSLPSFGDYQDAMLVGEPYLYHSFIAHYINVGLLDPLDVCSQIEAAYAKGNVPLNAAEGYIRQIIGWREFIRGIYWKFMPGYKKSNALRASRELPEFFWHGKTKMQCLAQVITMTRDYAYSHHIQRLMITGNFALLAGLKVQFVCDWYLAVYTDAFEWVELPNTLGMTLFADNGVVGSKPYIASGAYIKRMSNFCEHCEYQVKKRTGDKACPFNYLYWNFVMQHKDKLEHNRRLGFVYKNLERIDETEKKDIKAQARRFFKAMDAY